MSPCDTYYRASRDRLAKKGSTGKTLSGYCNFAYRFGFLQYGDVGVGVFPEGEEILVCT
jgi:hypothetical protein